ncbi:hypothetical protein AV656_03350 [Bhargavaea cecembensis]|uniref:Lipoprotein n=1 Tax=Bhargavaea cecembensis TaxID=394098 RepID=A0A163GJ12_9BACL|nr:hypothetical protein [Bhargavaea cecembensis]KZE40311.1 hypothetical protein AV656_03350 [Bhargavaea cecembensis]
MNRKSVIVSLLTLALMVLAACSNSESSGDPSPAEEFDQYRTEGIDPIHERSLELAEMGGHLNAMIPEPEKARDYITDEMISYIEETRVMAEELQDGLINQEIKEVNQITIDQLNLMADSFNKQAEFLELHIPPVSDESYAESEAVYAEIMQLQEQIDEKTSEYNTSLDDLEQKYSN